MIRYPNIVGKSDSQKLEQIGSYLHQLADELNFQLDKTGNLMSGYASTANGTSDSVKPIKRDDAVSNFNDIKALIIKSADIVSAYYSAITKLIDQNNLYVAESDFGTYKEETQAQLNASADRIEAVLTKHEQIESDMGDLERELRSEISQQADSIKMEVTNGTDGKSASIKLSVGDSVYTGNIDMTGLVSFKNLSAEGETTINGSNVKTGKISADLIDVLSLFAKDITMTGKFESTVEAYLPPTYDDAVYLFRALFWPDEYPLPEGYDFDLNGDGVFDEDDAIAAMKVYTGELPMSSLPGAAKTTATLRIDMSNSEKTIHIFGTNMWGTYVETFIGADVNNCSFASREYLQRMVNQDLNSTTLYRLVNGEKEYFNPPMEVGVEYRTTERYMGNPVYVQLVSFGALPNTNQANKNVYQGGEGGTTNVHHSDIIDITGRAYMGYNEATGEWSAFPFVYGGKDFGADVWYDNELGIVVRTQFDLSNQLAWFTVKYTKI